MAILKDIKDNAFLIGIILTVVSSGALCLYRIDANEKAMRDHLAEVAIKDREIQIWQLTVKGLETDMKYMKDGIDRLERLMDSINEELRTR